MIHLGWAIHANHEKMIIEGIAYLAFSFVDCHPEPISGWYEDISPVDSLLRLAGEWTNHPELGQWVDGVVAAEPTPSLQVLEGTGAQLKISQVLDAGHPLLDSELAWFSSTSIPSLWSQLEYAVGLLFAAKPGNFVTLHLVTGLFGMEQGRISERVQIHTFIQYSSRVFNTHSRGDGSTVITIREYSKFDCFL